MLINPLDKDALRERLMLRKDYSPLVAYVGRLDHQKGLHLVRHALFYALQRGAQFVLLVEDAVGRERFEVRGLVLERLDDRSHRRRRQQHRGDEGCGSHDEIVPRAAGRRHGKSASLRPGGRSAWFPLRPQLRCSRAGRKRHHGGQAHPHGG